MQTRSVTSASLAVLITSALSASVAAAQGGIRITEYLYDGVDGEYIELTNTSSAPIDVTGWSFDDDSRVAGTVDLSSAGVIAPGQSFLLVGLDPAVFAANWSLSGVTLVGPNTAAAIGRNDELNVYDAAGVLVDRLTYGDQTFPGTHRARDIAAHLCADALGRNDVYRTFAAVAGDAFGSITALGGNVGSPGLHLGVACPTLGAVYCTSTPSSTGGVAALAVRGSARVAQNDVTLGCSGLPLNSFGFFIAGRTQGSVPFPGGSQGNLCLGGSIGRYSALAQNSGSTGVVALAIDLGALQTPTGPVAGAAGETWNFQYWFRDANPTTTSNFSDAVAVTWQ